MYGLDAAVEGWQPDLMTFGKVIGGGLPVGAFGGRADIMGYLAPIGPVYQAGTLSGNPIATAAGLANLRGCDDAVYRHLDQTAVAVGDLASAALSVAGVPHRLQRAGNLFSIFFADGKVENYDQARRQSNAAYAAFFHGMLDAGVYLPPSAFEAWFVSAAHDDRALDRIADALPGAPPGPPRRPPPAERYGWLFVHCTSNAPGFISPDLRPSALPNTKRFPR